MSCEDCKAERARFVPYIAYESAMARNEREKKRLWITIILLILLLVGTNFGWLYYESQFEDVTQTVEQEADNGTNTFIGGDSYGEAESDHDNP